jgi:hypothetical protein
LLARRMPSPEEVWKSWRNKILISIALVLLAGAVYLRSDARKKSPSTLYFEPSSFSSASFMRSTSCPRIANVCFTPPTASKLSRALPTGVLQAESGAVSSLNPWLAPFAPTMGPFNTSFAATKLSDDGV